MPWQVPGYRPREDLAGGTGRVVLAADDATGELVVVKYLNPDSSHTSDDLRATIDDIEALPDDYFVRIRELVQESGHNAIVMDPVNGTTMRALIRDGGAFEPESALIVFRDILTGLTYAHALDIVHGDVSPENVMINADGRPVMLNVGEATWDPRELGLSSGVYLAPERWSGGPPTAAADVYAATIGFVESLTGEPPYWEDTDLERLRRRHESEDIDVSGVPAALHDVVRAGMAKSADSRSAAALLDLVETAATAGYGRDWQDRGRDGVIQRVRSGSLPLGAAPTTEAGGDVRDTEDVANDDYYSDVSPADGNADGDAASTPSAESPSGSASRDATAADAVMAAAADIVAFAQLRDAAEADAILAAAADEELTAEEESAVAEIERLLFPDEPSAAADRASANDATGVEIPGADAAPEADAPSSIEHEADAPAGAEMGPDSPAGVDVEANAAAGAGALAANPDRVPTQPPGAERAPAESDADRAPVQSDADRTPSEAGSQRIPTPAASAESVAAAESLAAAEVIAATAAAEHAAAADAQRREFRGDPTESVTFGSRRRHDWVSCFEARCGSGTGRFRDPNRWPPPRVARSQCGRGRACRGRSVGLGRGRPDRLGHASGGRIEPLSRRGDLADPRAVVVRTGIGRRAADRWDTHQRTGSAVTFPVRDRAIVGGVDRRVRHLVDSADVAAHRVRAPDPTHGRDRRGVHRGRSASALRRPAARRGARGSSAPRTDTG